MIEKQDVIAFFNRCAPTWDAEMVRNDAVIEKILDNADVTKNAVVLDVACGTGVLFSDYLKRGVKSVTGIDISPKMIEIAKEKCIGTPIHVICGDVEEVPFENAFDVVMVYNAFPHFPEPKHLIQTLAALVKKGGRLSIAHGMSRSKIDSHHKGFASKVSNGLMHENELKKLLEPYFDVDIIISNDVMYQVCGKRRSLSSMH